MKKLMESWNNFLEEEDDRCTRIAKRKYDTWPSAYASGAVVQCRKGKIWKDLKEEGEVWTGNTEIISLLGRISDKLDTLEDIDTSIDYLASALSGDDPLSVNIRQKMLGRFAAPEKDELKKEILSFLEEKAKTDYSKEKESGLHGWFSRQGGKGGSSGWVDCNTCRKDPKTGRKKCKSCGRGEGEKRSEYPSCRPTPSACGTAGKGKKWGKKSEEISLTEDQIDSIVEDILAQLEEGGKCTGPTQKASSTSKGKKWMQCVKNPDGKGYKRIHWGQKGVRVTGDSGDTKRKKSFRARHGCSDAKPGTAKYMACKDW